MVCNDTYIIHWHSEILDTLLNIDEQIVLLIWDEHNQILYASDSVGKYFNITEKELIHQSIKLLFPANIVSDYERHFNYSSEKLVIPNINFKHCKNNHHQFNLLVIEIEVDEQFFYICQLKQISDELIFNQMVSTRDQAQFPSQLMEEFIHEIRNPLTSLRGFLQLIQAGIKHPEKYCTALLNEIDKIDNMTNELFNFSNGVENKYRIEFVHQLINEVLLLFRVQPEMNYIEFERRMNEDLTIYCNPDEIKQALINIIKNAIEAMNKIGKINIKTRRIDNSVLIEIIDEGPGIQAGFIDRLHEPYYSTKEEGMGLGLVITKRIINKHEGKLIATNLDNKKTCFSIELPLYLMD